MEAAYGQYASAGAQQQGRSQSPPTSKTRPQLAAYQYAAGNRLNAVDTGSQPDDSRQPPRALTFSPAEYEMLHHYADTQITLLIADGSGDSSTQSIEQWRQSAVAQEPGFHESVRSVLGYGAVDFEISLQNVQWAFAEVQAAKERGDGPSYFLHKGLLNGFFYSGFACPAFRFLTAAHRENILNVASQFAADVYAPPQVQHMALESYNKLVALAPARFSDDQEQAATSFDRGIDTLHSLAMLQMRLFTVLVQPEPSPVKDILTVLEDTEKLLGTTADFDDKVLCLSLATAICPYRRFLIAKSAFLPPVVQGLAIFANIHNFAGIVPRQALENTGSVEQVQAPANTGQDDVDEMSETSAQSKVGNHNTTGNLLRPIGHHDFDNAKAAEDFMRKKRRQIAVGDDGLSKVCSNKQQVKLQIRTAFWSFINQHPAQSDAEAKAQQHQTKKYHEFEQFVKDSEDKEELDKMVAALAESIVVLVIELHLHGDFLNEDLLPKSFDRKANDLSAAQRIENITYTLLTYKDICMDLLHKFNVHATALFVASPKSAGEDKARWSVSNARRAQTYSKTKSSAAKYEALVAAGMIQDDEVKAGLKTGKKGKKAIRGGIFPAPTPDLEAMEDHEDDTGPGATSMDNVIFTKKTNASPRTENASKRNDDDQGFDEDTQGNTPAAGNEAPRKSLRVTDSTTNLPAAVGRVAGTKRSRDAVDPDFAPRRSARAAKRREAGDR